MARLWDSHRGVTASITEIGIRRRGNSPIQRQGFRDGMKARVRTLNHRRPDFNNGDEYGIRMCRRYAGTLTAMMYHGANTEALHACPAVGSCSHGEPRCAATTDGPPNGRGEPRHDGDRDAGDAARIYGCEDAQGAMREPGESTPRRTPTIATSTGIRMSSRALLEAYRDRFRSGYERWAGFTDKADRSGNDDVPAPCVRRRCCEARSTTSATIASPIPTTATSSAARMFLTTCRNPAGVAFGTAMSKLGRSCRGTPAGAEAALPQAALVP